MDASFNIEANPRIIKIRKLLELNTRDMRQMARSVDIQFTKNERRLFSTEGSSGGSRWQKLSPKYAKWKRKVRPGKKIMTFDGKLRGSLTGRQHPGHSMHWALKPITFIRVGTKDPKAAWHGPPNPLKNTSLPERDVIQHTPGQERGYYGIIKDYFLKVKVSRFMRAASAWKGRRR